jgi:hypothetical protein
MMTRDKARAGAYARAALDDACAKIASARPGGRNALLNGEAFAVGQLAGAGALERADAEASLLAAALACGLAASEARATIKSGLDAGINAPRDLDKVGGGFSPPTEQAQKERSRSADYAKRILRESRPAAGTLAERYLRSVRGLEPGQALNALRFHDGVWHKEAGRCLPAMVAPVWRGEAAEPCAVHVTYLAPDGAKAGVEPARRMFGPVKGGAVILPGFGDGGPVIVTEGVEKGLACRRAAGFGVRAALSASLMPSMRLPDTARTVIICADRGAAGEVAAEKSAAVWTAAGKEARVCFPPLEGKDWDECPLDAVRAAIGSATVWRPAARAAGAPASAALAEGWPEPDMTIVRRVTPPPPLDLALLAPLDDLVRSIAGRKGASPDLVALGLLTSASVFVSVKRRARPWPGWSEPGVLWGAAVMPPSHNKSPALDPFRDALRHVEQALAGSFAELTRRHEAQKLAAEAARMAWELEVKEAVRMGYPPPPLPEKAEAPPAPVRPRLWASDVTAQKAARLMKAQPGGLLVYRDELAGWIGGFGQFSNGGASDRAFWLECYGGRPHRLDRVGDGEFDVPFASASVLGAITPDGVNELVLSGARDGFAARFVFVWPEPVPPKRPADAPCSQAELQRVFSRLAELRMDANEFGEPAPRDLPLAEAAADALQRWRVELHRRAQDAHGLYGDALGKQPGLALRLANVIEHLLWAAGSGGAEPSEIGAAAIGQAIRVVDGWVTPHLERVLGLAGVPKADAAAETLARWLLKRRCERFNASHVRRNEHRDLGGLRLSREMDEACAELVEAGWIRAASVRAGGGKGRMSKDFEVNPLIHQIGRGIPHN